jgi:hypothetical protein
MNGTTPVASGAGHADIFRINGFRVETAGATGAATGTIDVYHASAATIYSQIQIGETRARNIQYTVPAGKEVYIQEMSASSGNATADKSYARIILRAKYDDKSYAASSVMVAWAELVVDDGSITKIFPVPIRIPEKIDLEVVAVGASGTTAAAVSASIRGYTETE